MVSLLEKASRAGRQRFARSATPSSRDDRAAAKAFFPEQHTGGNAHGNGGNVSAWPDRVGA
jgi:hypothetical protein